MHEEATNKAIMKERIFQIKALFKPFPFRGSITPFSQLTFLFLSTAHISVSYKMFIRLFLEGIGRPRLACQSECREGARGDGSQWGAAAEAHQGQAQSAHQGSIPLTIGLTPALTL